MSTSSYSATAQELVQLKVAVLDSVLNDAPFPGSETILKFPDLPFVLAQDAIYLMDEGIREKIYIEKLDRQVQPVSEKFLIENTPESGRTIFFKFRSKQEEKDRLLLHLDANVFSTSDKRTSALSSLYIKFQKVGNIWTILEPPSFLSA